jgi:hypothetical protein
MRYINKSVFIEAVQFDGRNLPEIEEFIEYSSNVMSVTILNNVLYCIIQSHDKAEAVRLVVMPNDYLVKDASGWVTNYEEEQIKDYWIPFNYKK